MVSVIIFEKKYKNIKKILFYFSKYYPLKSNRQFFYLICHLELMFIFSFYWNNVKAQKKLQK